MSITQITLDDWKEECANSIVSHFVFNESTYSKNEDAFVVEADQSVSKVLIAAYFRSGSSLVGEIATLSNDAFYLF